MAKPREASAISFGISGLQNVAILRQARHNAQQIKRSTADHYRIELKLSLGQVLIK